MEKQYLVVGKAVDSQGNVLENVSERASSLNKFFAISSVESRLRVRHGSYSRFILDTCVDSSFGDIFGDIFK